MSNAGQAGHNELRFFGNLNAEKRLKPGRYALTITASANGLTSARPL